MNVPLRELGNSLSRGNYVWLLPGVGLQLLGMVARSQRWVVLLGEDAKLIDSFWAQGIGCLFTNLLPLRMGEPARVAVMSNKSGLALVQVAASVLLERLLDVATVVLVLILVLPWMRVPELVIRAGIAFGLLVLVALALLFSMVRFDRQSQALLRTLCRLVPTLPAGALLAWWSELAAGLSPLTRRATAAKMVGWSGVTWALSIAVYWCVIHAFQPDGNVLEAAFMDVALALAITVPSSPGFIGVFQLVGQQALVLPFGAKYSPGSALAITLGAYMIYYILTTLMGVGGLWRFGESFVKLARAVSSRRPRAVGSTSGTSIVR